MTIVTTQREGHVLHGICVSGHSGYAYSGSDIVCAGASVLITTCINALEAVANVQPKVRQDEQTATIAMSLPVGLSPEMMHDAQVILKATLQGFEDLSSQYPQHVMIIDRR